MQDAIDPRPQMLQMSSRQRRFAAASAVPQPDGMVLLKSGRHGHAPTRLSEQDYRLARLYEGTRDAAAIAREAGQQLGLQLTPRQLEGFASDLAQSGLLFPGTHEPLPVSAYTEHEARELGWTGLAPGIAGRAPSAAPLPPSSVPGSRGNPGLTVARDGIKPELDYPFAPDLLIGLGRWFNWPLQSGLLLSGALLLTLILSVGVFVHRLGFRDSLQGWWSGGLTWPLLLLAVVITHLVSSAARAHAIARYTPEAARTALRLGFFKIPFVFVDTGGVIQRSPRPERLRLLGAPLMASLLLLAGAACGWLMWATTQPRLGEFLALLAMVVLASLILRVNPLTNRDGYLLLSHWLGIVDLREQAVLAIYGSARPWSQQVRKLPRSILAAYAILSAGYIVAVLAMTLQPATKVIGGYFGSTGIVLLLSLIGAYMFRQFTKDKIASARDTLGWNRNWSRWLKLSPREKFIAGAVVVLCCFPYRYAPSGEMVVLPSARADVRALVAGDVLEVLVAEGDTVKAGQIIARLRADEPRARVAQSQATLAQLQADLAAYKRGAKAEEVDVARQRVNTQRKRAEVAHENAKRLKEAFDKHSITAYEYDRARGTADVEDQALLEAQRALDLTSSPAMADQVTAKEAQVAAAAATLEYNRSELANTEIKAPIEGRIVSGLLMFAVGTFMHQGDLLARVENSTELLAEIKLPESSVGDEIRPGNDATAKSWAYPGTSFDGTVRSVAPSAEIGAYGKVVRVQMSIKDPDGLLKPEMTGNAKADGDRHMAIVVFTRALRRFLFVEVWSWLP